MKNNKDGGLFSQNGPGSATLEALEGTVGAGGADSIVYAGGVGEGFARVPPS